MTSAVGELVLTQLWDDGDCTRPPRLRIDRADPVIRISQLLLDFMARDGWGHPDVSFDGELVKIDAVNGRLVYRLMRKEPDSFCWIAAWPD